MNLLNGSVSSTRVIRVADLRAYLLSKGWKIKPFRRPQVIYFEGPPDDEGRPLVLLVPASEQLRDYPLRLEEILNTLSNLEGRPIADIVRNIITPTSDILHLRLDSPETRTGTLELGSVAQFFAGLKDLLVFAACGQFEPKAYYPRALKQAVLFAERCRYSPQPAGSFRADVETPITPPANEAQIQLGDYPVERLILVSLMKGLGELEGAIDSGQTAALLEQPSRRINANLCEAILGMRLNMTDVIWEARASWSPAWPLVEPIPQAVAFEGKAFEQIDSIGRALRAGSEPRKRSLHGKIIRLSGKDPIHGESGPLVVTLAGDSANTPPTVEMTLTPEQYRVAGQAHLDGHRIAVKGVLNRVGRKWQLLDVADFQVVNEVAS